VTNEETEATDYFNVQMALNQEGEAAHFQSFHQFVTFNFEKWF